MEWTPVDLFFKKSFVFFWGGYPRLSFVRVLAKGLKKREKID